MKNKTLAITGHTRGLGKALYELYPSSLGFSRSTGYQIENDADSIINQIIDCDVFINNAYHETAQQYLFEQMWHQWRDNPTKTIVNISSMIALGIRQDVDALSKKQAREKFLELLYLPRKCKMVNVNLGRFGDNHKSAASMSEQQAAELVSWCINQPGRIEVGELSVWMLESA